MLLLIGLGALGGAVVVAVLTLVGAPTSRVDVARVMAVAHPRRPGGYLAPRDQPMRQRFVVPLVRRLGGLGRALTPTAAVARLQRHLDYAGNPPGWPVERVVPLKGLTLAAGAALGAALGLLFGAAAGAIVGAIVGAALGLFAPDLMVYNAGLKRQQEVLLSLPDVLDTLVISVEAGLGFDAAMAQVGQNGKGPLAREMVRVLQEMQIGKSRPDALRALAQRTTVADLRTFVTAVVQAGELGVPIAAVLREHAREMRIRRRQRAEELAQKVPIKILFPVLFCLFPSLFVVILGPGVLQIMAAFAR
ncbi:tight adherence protein C [Micromonospora pattaloongensis]|uniref:Tight adherence protein C n=1 Tax=Micromonospora pattaloongensis TaxID=405436 RepID=A0A1H3NQI5_9ACTN|nr:type II secretion system F family protein [Micromonospora pattaloongensis]SDY90705.1 tight adherence protein C [Micromonospora pattaloongensis]